MARKIEKDNSRFKQIVRGKIKKELKKYISHGEMIGKRGKDLVSIPVPYIVLPHFRHGRDQSGGVGQGGKDPVGTPIGVGPAEKGPGAGDRPADHILEVDIPLEELAKMLGEELELPNLEPKGKKNIVHQRHRYKGLRSVGPESMKHFKMSYKKAMRRQIASGEYNPDKPVVIPYPEDKLYRSWKEVEDKEACAAILYMMDVSGSMMDEQKEIVRREAFWIDAWISSQYKGVVNRYIIHDAVAHEVDQHAFYHTRESGGTMISSAYKLGMEIAKVDYALDQWNVYVFHFSDGDNWGEDNDKSVHLLEELFLFCNLFGYVQVKSPHGSGEFLKVVKDRFGGRTEKFVASEVKDQDGIYASLREVLGKGRVAKK